ncbi:MAG: CopG family ribbon-helix-helix protein [Candidatus Baldrarchaeia archaeon]
MAEAEIVKLKNENVVTIIMVTREYARIDIELRLSELRHKFDDVVVENIHRHIGKQYCLDIFIAEEKHSRILDLIGRIRGMRGIQQIKTIFMQL